MQYEYEQLRKKFNFDSTVSVYGVSIEGNVSIGKHTYINEFSRVDTGPGSRIQIGSHCAIGRYVHITSKEHDLFQPTTDEDHPVIKHAEADVMIGNYVWIGDKVTILPGVIISDYAIIGAHSLVNTNVKAFEIVGGIPSRHIGFNTKHYRNK